MLEDKGTVIGAVSGDVLERETGFVEDIAVRVEHRRKGYGSQLLAELLKRFKARGIWRVRLSVHYRCSAALPFYYGHGFRMTKIVRDGYGPGQDYVVLEREI